MISQSQLLKHVFSASDTISKETDNTEHLALLEGAKAAINEIILREDNHFYLDCYRSGCELFSLVAALLGRDDTAALPDCDDHTRTDVLNQGLAELQSRFTAMVQDLDDHPSPEGRNLLRDIVAWQESLHLRHLDAGGEPAEEGKQGFTEAALLDYLRHKFPDWRNLEITRFSLLAGGFSKTTILFETRDDLNGHQAMVIRAEQPLNLLFYAGADVRKEFAMIQLMHREGVPVAEPLWLEEDRSQLGNRFLVSRCVKGRNVGGNLGSENPLPDAVLDDYFRVMIRLHSIEVDPGDDLVQASHLAEWLSFDTLTECLRYYVTDYFEQLIIDNEIDVTPDIQRALVWLRRNVPQSDEKPSIIHIDFNWNNLLVDDDRIVAVLDWESSRFGDPAEEMLSSLPSLTGVMSLEEMVEIYRKNTGREISKFRLLYGQITKFVLNAITMLRAEKMLALSLSASIRLSLLGFAYRGYFLKGLNELIEKAEAARD